MSDAIALTIPAGRRFESVVSLVLGGIGSRLDLPVSRIDDLRLAVANVAEGAASSELVVRIDVHNDRVSLRVGPIETGAGVDRARRLLIDPLVDGVTAVEEEGLDWLELEVGRGDGG